MRSCHHRYCDYETGHMHYVEDCSQLQGHASLPKYLTKHCMHVLSFKLAPCAWLMAALPTCHAMPGSMASYRQREVWLVLLQVHIITASCENMIDGRGMRPGDILQAANGKTVEVCLMHQLLCASDMPVLLELCCVLM